MSNPNDPCVGEGVSTRGLVNNFDDIYPPTDYEVNPTLFDYKQAVGSDPCVSGRYGYYHPGVNTTSGGASGDGVVGVGPGSVTFTNVARVVVFADFPLNGNVWPGGPGIPFWGSNFNGYWAKGNNVDHMDGHAKWYSTNYLTPNGQEDTGPMIWWNSSTFAGKGYRWWGTNFADPSFQ
jgi:hypothetical protein